MDLKTEQNLFKSGNDIIGGIDEVGRGPLAGPVVAACVTIKKGVNIDDPKLEEIKDSKKITPKKRAELFEFIKSDFFEVGIGICDHETIDRVNILQATFLAMKMALGSLKNKPDHLLVDGSFIVPNISTKQTAIVKGDQRILIIAAASIIAKETRDNLMILAHEKYPEYGFDKHKGYGTKLHMEKLKELGATPIHRQSFAPVKSLRQIEK